MAADSRARCWEIPSDRIALHFARLFTRLDEAMRPRVCDAEDCLEIVRADGPSCPAHQRSA